MLRFIGMCYGAFFKVSKYFTYSRIYLLYNLIDGVNLAFASFFYDANNIAIFFFKLFLLKETVSNPSFIRVNNLGLSPLNSGLPLQKKSEL